MTNRGRFKGWIAIYDINCQLPKTEKTTSKYEESLQMLAIHNAMQWL